MLARALLLATVLAGCDRPAGDTRPLAASVLPIARAPDDAAAVHRSPSSAAVYDAPEAPLASAPLATARPARAPFDGPTAESWPVAARWSASVEQDYARFVARIGEAVRDRRCARLDRCLRDPSVNTLYDPDNDAQIQIDVDCADLPYVLRGYFAFKKRLPFGFVSWVQETRTRRAPNGEGVAPGAWRTWRTFPTPRAVIRGAVERVSSLMYRTPAETERSDFYPVQIRRGALRPGTIYYDPNGHVLVVSEVRDDGQVYLIDGHPDGTLTWKRFGAAFALGTRRLGGGFKNHRPQRLDATGALVWAPNAELTDRDDGAQWDASRWVVSGATTTFPAWVRASLARAGAAQDPVQDFREQVQALCRDVADRVVAVDLALAAGIHRRPHPGALPENIYGTTGDWETWSTPSRDARLKALAEEISQVVDALPPASPLRASLRAVWTEVTAAPDCAFRYTNSAGAPVALSLDDVLDRLFDLSFDPAHCPELRWGAPEGSAERASCPDDDAKRRWYRAERRLRNRIERVYGVPTPLTDGPERPASVDPRPRLGVTADRRSSESPSSSRGR